MGDTACLDLRGWIRRNFTYINYIIFLIAFSQGFQGLADLAIFYLFKDDYKLEPWQQGFLLSFVDIPWMIKPLWGFISDSFPLFGYRRKPYLIILSFFNAIGFLMLSKYDFDPQTTTMILVSIQMCVAFCNVIGEALIVEMSKEETKDADEEKKNTEAAKKVSLFFGSRNVGYILTSYLSGLLVKEIGKRNVFMLTSIFPLIITLSAAFLDEKEAHLEEDDEQIDREDAHLLSAPGRKPSKCQNIRKLFRFCRKKEILAPVLLIFFFQATPSTGDAMKYFFTEELGFDEEFLGRLGLVTSIGSLLGIIIYNKFLSKVPFKTIFIVSTMICVVVSLTQILLVTRFNKRLGIPDGLFCFTDNFVITVFGEINFMPILVLACRMCPKNIEGTMYALMMSVLNFGGLVSRQLGALLTNKLGISKDNFDNLWLLILLANLSWLIPMIGVNLVNFEQASEVADKHVVDKHDDSLIDSADTPKNPKEIELGTAEPSEPKKLQVVSSA